LVPLCKIQKMISSRFNLTFRDKSLTATTTYQRTKGVRYSIAEKLIAD
jgi:hypothetical protein